MILHTGQPNAANTMPRAKSSLTPQQVTHLKDQLTEILDNSKSKYEIEVTPNDHEAESKKRTKNPKSGHKNPKSGNNQLFVKPLSKQDIEMQQRALSFQIGQEIKTRGQIQPIETKKQQPLVQNEPIKSPRVCYSYETHQSKERVDETNDFLLVLTSPSQNEPEVQATVENWATREEDEPPARPRSVTEIAKSFEEGLNNDNLPKPLTPTRNQIESSVSVEQAKKSFEHQQHDSELNEMKIHATSSTENQATADDLTTTTTVAQIQTIADLNNVEGIADHLDDEDEILDNKTRQSPQRTDSFCKAIQSSLGKLSKSTSSLENVLDEEYPRSLGVFNEVSMSNPDISDNEMMSNNKVVVQQMSSHQRPRSRMIHGEQHPGHHPGYHHPGSKSGGSMIGLNRSLSPGTCGTAGNQTKYSRAYLTLVKTGDVTNKLCKFDPNHFPKGYSYKIIQQSKKMTKDYVNKNVTNTQKVNIKAKEHGHVLDTLKKLEAKHNPAVAEIIDINNHATSSGGVGAFIDPATIPSKSNLSWTDQKAKLKHFCKKMSHTKILSKMMTLQGTPGALQLGTEKLLNKSNQEDLLKNVYQGGQVESKVDFFEKPGHNRPISSPGPEWMTNSLKHNDSASFFSWSKRLNPEDQTSSAEKHNQFRKYYGYHPGEVTQPLKPKYFLEQQQQESPASLPLFLENLPPPPPIRTNTLNKGADF